MEIILLEKHSRLGNIGDTVEVKNGYARNFLIPTKKALRATSANKALFEARKQEIQKEFEDKKSDAEKIVNKINGKSLILVRQCSEDLRLYGSVNANDIVKTIKDQLSQELPKSSVNLINQIKYAGIYQVPVTIFADIQATVKLSIGRTETEAKNELKNETANKLKKEAEELEKAQPAPEGDTVSEEIAELEELEALGELDESASEEIELEKKEEPKK